MRAFGGPREFQSMTPAIMRYLKVSELKKFLRENGEKSIDSSECTAQNWPEELAKCIKVLNICWKDDSVSDTATNDVLSSVASLIIQLPPQKLEKITELLCTKYLDFTGDNVRKHKSKLFSLNLLFSGLPNQHQRYLVYLTLVSCASKLGMLNQIITDPKKVADWLVQFDCTDIERRQVWRKLHEVHLELGETRRATDALVYLLSTFTDSDAADARQDAVKCIISVLQDPALLSHDQLYTLKPVQYLEGEPVHDFFKIFVSGSMSNFKTFIAKHPDFLKQNSLNEEACLRKLRLLTLMQISEHANELSYAAATKELELTADQLEPFIIDAVRQRAVACKLDQVNQRILITGAFPRTFGHPQWVKLHETLLQWRSGLKSVRSSIGAIVNGQQKGDGAAALAP